ncbi:hypothetical protein [uncultured Acetobacteroides sp.]|uniref:hypothetical protein n=1 Tax=uncultured Acetobacteroides sp. TaxID=1760811 RepID=UPI0029F567CF|nr:hypothetical protein [uncultured Acetobacteroides sp.]
MARSIAEIKHTICAEFMGNESAAAIYRFKVGDDFNATFSTVSVESILFYTVAVCIWTLETLFDRFRSDVSTRIDEIIAHRPKWYRDKVLAFMVNKTLVPDKDYYDSSLMSVNDIEAARVVKHAVATENKDASILTIKVAGETNGIRTPLPKEVEVQLDAYIYEIKDAGVRINLVNIAPDEFNLSCDIYYNPMLLPENVQNACIDAVKSYIENLPFNGMYTNMDLVDTLQKVDGVKVVELRESSSKEAGVDTTEAIDAVKVPAAGYFVLKSSTFTMKPYEQ